MLRLSSNKCLVVYTDNWRYSLHCHLQSTRAGILHYHSFQQSLFCIVHSHLWCDVHVAVVARHTYIRSSQVEVWHRIEVRNIHNLSELKKNVKPRVVYRTHELQSIAATSDNSEYYSGGILPARILILMHLDHLGLDLGICRRDLPNLEKGSLTCRGTNLATIPSDSLRNSRRSLYPRCALKCGLHIKHHFDCTPFIVE